MNPPIQVSEQEGRCQIHQDQASGVTVLDFSPAEALQDHRQAIELANRLAAEQAGEVMMLSWYDRDRDVESPQHASECHQDSATPGYVDYALHHGANLLVVIEAGRFVFYYTHMEP